MNHIARGLFVILAPVVAVAACDGGAPDLASQTVVAQSVMNRSSGGGGGNDSEGGRGGYGDNEETGGHAGHGGRDSNGGGSPEGACLDDADTAILVDPANDIPGAMAGCEQMSLEQERVTLDCMKMLGLTEACASCFDEAVRCIIGSCAGACLDDPSGEACLDCREMHCDLELATCVGFIP